MAFLVSVLGDVQSSFDQDLQTLFGILTRLSEFAEDANREGGSLVVSSTDAKGEVGIGNLAFGPVDLGVFDALPTVWMPFITR